jgi:hypothetical protein
VALRRVESTLKRLRAGARTLVVRTNVSEVVDTVVRWAAVGQARHEVHAFDGWTELRVYLLPREFDEHPFLAWRPVLQSPERGFSSGIRSLGATFSSSTPAGAP